MNTFPQSARWVEKAISLRPKLHEILVAPAQLSLIEKDENAFAGWKATPGGDVAEIENCSWKKGESFTFDLENHHVGYLQFELSVDG